MNAANLNSPDRQTARSFRWPLIVLGLLVGHMSLMAVAVTFATRAHRDAVLPEYYRDTADGDRAPSPAPARGVTP